MKIQFTASFDTDNRRNAFTFRGDGTGMINLLTSSDQIKSVASLADFVNTAFKVTIEPIDGDVLNTEKDQ